MEKEVKLELVVSDGEEDIYICVFIIDPEDRSGGGDVEGRGIVMEWVRS